MDEDERREAYDEFNALVNMAPKDLEDWLETDESKDVGQSSSKGSESVGHKSGKRIVAIKRTNKDDLSDDDYAHMRKVVGYIHRHLAQGGPESGKKDSPWRYSLMNWGHDPLK